MSFKTSVKKFDNFIPEINDLEKEGFLFTPVGSRVTSRQLFTRENDYDFLIYLNPSKSDYLNKIDKFRSKGFIGNGDYGLSAQFVSMKKETPEYIVNIIIVHSITHFDDFIFASNIAKDLNLTNKQDRIILFDYITRGHGKFSIKGVLDTKENIVNENTTNYSSTNSSYYSGPTLDTLREYQQAFSTSSYVTIQTDSGRQTGYSY